MDAQELLSDIRRECQRLYRLAFPEKYRKYAHAAYNRNPTRGANWIRRNRNRHLATRRDWYRRKKAHPRRLKSVVALRLTSRLWRAKHKQHRKRYQRKWHAAHPHKNAEYCMKRHALKMHARIGDRAAIDKIYARAKELCQWFDVVVDHIIPLSKGGAHAADNLQIIYKFENARKNDHLDYKPSVIFT